MSDTYRTLSADPTWRVMTDKGPEDQVLTTAGFLASGVNDRGKKVGT